MSSGDEGGEVCRTKGQVVDTGVEALMCSALERPAPYYAKVLEPIANQPGAWNSLRVGIFQRPEADTSVQGYTTPKVSDSDVMIGEYTRNYHSVMRTFHPFQLRGKWFALYSKDYTSTRVMELPSCKDLGGEEGDSWGFCPVDFWVPDLNYIQSICDEDCPRYKSETHKPDYTKSCTCYTKVTHGHGCPINPETRVKNQSCISNEGCRKSREEWDKKHHIWHFPDRVHGFVAGCVWGDDSSWKIQYLDLSRADEGIIKREERFGYIELPAHLDLSKAVNLEAGDGYWWLRIATESNFELATGKSRADEDRDYYRDILSRIAKGWKTPQTLAQMALDHEWDDPKMKAELEKEKV